MPDPIWPHVPLQELQISRKRDARMKLLYGKRAVCSTILPESLAGAVNLKFEQTSPSGKRIVHGTNQPELLAAMRLHLQRFHCCRLERRPEHLQSLFKLPPCCGAWATTYICWAANVRFLASPCSAQARYEIDCQGADGDVGIEGTLVQRPTAKARSCSMPLLHRLGHAAFCDSASACLKKQGRDGAPS